jgi:hypothetical protein
MSHALTRRQIIIESYDYLGFPRLMIHKVHLIFKDYGKLRICDERVVLRAPIHQVEFRVPSQIWGLVNSQWGLRKRESSLSFLEGNLRNISALRS